MPENVTAYRTDNWQIDLLGKRSASYAFIAIFPNRIGRHPKMTEIEASLETGISTETFLSRLLSHTEMPSPKKILF